MYTRRVHCVQRVNCIRCAELDVSPNDRRVYVYTSRALRAARELHQMCGARRESKRQAFVCIHVVCIACSACSACSQRGHRVHRVHRVQLVQRVQRVSRYARKQARRRSGLRAGAQVRA